MHDCVQMFGTREIMKINYATKDTDESLRSKNKNVRHEEVDQ